MADEIDLFHRLKTDRGTWENHWQRLGEIMHPVESEFVNRDTPGERKNNEIFDSTPLISARDLAAAIDSLLKPRTSQWFHLFASDSEFNQIDEVKIWLEEVQNRMFTAMYQRETRFVHASGSVDLSLIIFGTGVMFIGETQNLKNLSFKHLGLKDSYIMRNADGLVDTIYFEWRITAKQADQFFLGKPGPTAKAFLLDKRPEKIVRYLQCVMPRRDRDPSSKRGDQMPTASIWFDMETEVKVQERGFEEFPFVVPVWDQAFDEVYGRSPGMDALPDANTLNAQAKTMLIAGHKAVDPPLLIGDDSVIGSIRTMPGGNTYFNLEAARDIGRIPIEPMNTGANIPLGQDMMADTRNQVQEAFFKTRLKLPVNNPQMTATEVIERKQEFVMDFGPIFGRLETDYIGPLIDRVFNVMLRAGSFPPPPQVLLDRDVEFEYMSPITRSKKELEAAGFLRAQEILAPMAQVKPEILDIIDGDKVTYAISEAQGVPLTWMKSPDQVKQVRSDRAQRQAQLEQERKLASAVEQAATLADAGATPG